MGAPNFCTTNGHIHIVENTSWEDYRDEELTNDEISSCISQAFEDVFAGLKDDFRKTYEADKANRYSVKKIDGFHITGYVCRPRDDDQNDYCDRNYGGIKIGEIMAETPFFNTKIQLTMAVILRNGYYSGANIDQYFYIDTLDTSYGHHSFNSDDTLEDCISYVVDEICNESDVSEAKLNRYRQGIGRRLEAMKKLLWQRYDELVKPYCKEYGIFAQFDNGETIYVLKH